MTLAGSYGPAVCLVLAALASSGLSESPALRRHASGLPTITTQDGGEMVLIPAGSFEMGSRYGERKKSPCTRYGSTHS